MKVYAAITFPQGRKNSERHMVVDGVGRDAGEAYRRFLQTRNEYSDYCFRMNIDPIFDDREIDCRVVELTPEFADIFVVADFYCSWDSRSPKIDAALSRCFVDDDGKLAISPEDIARLPSRFYERREPPSTEFTDPSVRPTIDEVYDSCWSEKLGCWYSPDYD